MQEITNPLISVVVPAYNEEERISDCIEAILAQSYPHNKIELTIVDDCSTDRTNEIASRYPVKVIRNSINLGDSSSRNVGIRNSKGDLIATTDADDVVDKDWLTNLVKPFSEKEVGAVIGSSHIFLNNDNFIKRLICERSICSRGGLYVKNIYDSGGMVACGKSVGSNQSFTKIAFMAVGGFDPSLKSGMDQDIIWRIENAGYKIAFAPNAKVYIKQRGNFKKFLKQNYIRSKECISLYFRYPNKTPLSYIFCLLFIPIIVILYLFNLIFNSYLFLLLCISIITFPIFYLSWQTINISKYLLKSSDLIPLILLSYTCLIISSLGMALGFIRMIFALGRSII